MAREGGVRTAAFSPDGRYALTGGGSGARLWDAATAKPIGPAMSQEGGVETAAFSPDGRTILTTRSLKVQLWDMATAKSVGAPLAQGGGVRSVAFDGGRYVLTGNSMEARAVGRGHRQARPGAVGPGGRGPDRRLQPRRPLRLDRGWQWARLWTRPPPTQSARR